MPDPTRVHLDLFFPDPQHVVVRLGDEVDAQVHPFVAPISADQRRDLRWYIETYGALSLGEPDDAEAERIVARLPEWGRLLFHSVFAHDDALDRLCRFRQTSYRPRLLTITTTHSEILAVPWELLHGPASTDTFFFQEEPPTSIRRTVPSATAPSFRASAKARLHLLFVVSRPRDAGFLDPRADPQAILDALDQNATGRVTWEFLRPATLDGLVRRLADMARPPIDIVHFDGHGMFSRQASPRAAADSSSGYLT